MPGGSRLKAQVTWGSGLKSVTAVGEVE